MLKSNVHHVDDLYNQVKSHLHQLRQSSIYHEILEEDLDEKEQDYYRPENSSEHKSEKKDTRLFEEGSHHVGSVRVRGSFRPLGRGP